MWSFMPNFSSVGSRVWPPIENTHTHSHLYYIDNGRSFVKGKGKKPLDKLRSLKVVKFNIIRITTGS